MILCSPLPVPLATGAIAIILLQPSSIDNYTKQLDLLWFTLDIMSNRENMHIL